MPRRFLKLTPPLGWSIPATNGYAALHELPSTRRAAPPRRGDTSHPRSEHHRLDLGGVVATLTRRAAQGAPASASTAHPRSTSPICARALGSCSHGANARVSAHPGPPMATRTPSCPVSCSAPRATRTRRFRARSSSASCR
jgi:hypothetical protein